MIVPDRIKAFLDDLVTVYVKHGLDFGEVDYGGVLGVSELAGDFGGIEVTAEGDSGVYFKAGETRMNDSDIRSLDVSTITAHQRIAMTKSLSSTRTSAPTGTDILSDPGVMP